ncbi:thioesterase II family protein [Marinactinospora thermotolerans]|uniref:Surfactin synthase thioesterase subunit n=1 Tax=Marinactinospora thermotolerans DSM 45154 TaxID=1122192 RepID=A0A1T4QZW0_9ACTN|nr:alpha/beta fold hydrolase [Marinactinospora thermotolerans]SKA09352.1 Surfactin synthase thioesterase subunit [Marinactinospora thermotolerans DSM 45154]
MPETFTTSTDPDLWLRRFAPDPAAPARVLFLPHAGGAASFYRPLCRALAGVAEAIAVQYPGRQERRREPCVEDLHQMADLVAEVLAGAPERPTALFGHSMGAVVAFELALRLEERGAAPVALFVSARRAPSQYRVEDLYLQSDERVLEEIRRLDGTDTTFLEDEELVRLILPTLRSDYRAIGTYRPRPGKATSAPITVLVGDSDPRMSAPEAPHWAGHTSAGIDVHSFRGGHFYLAEHVEPVAGLIGRRLREAGVPVPAAR